MPATDVALLTALGHEDRLAIIELLLESPATQTEIREALGLGSGTASKHLASLEAVGLVTRVRSHAPYELVLGRETLGLLERVASLAARLAHEQATSSEARARRLRKLGMAKGASGDQVAAGNQGTRPSQP